VSYRQTVLLTSTITTSVTSATAVYGATTSTAIVTTVSVTVTGTTEASTLLSTSSGFVTLTQTNLVTQVLDVTTSATSLMTAIGNPPLELALACVIIFSLVVIGINVVRRSGPRRSVQCPRCGFNNPSARIYCVNCGEPLKGS